MTGSTFACALCVVLGPGAAAGATVWYVNASATGSATGLTWQDAFPTLQSALTAATSGDQVWAARGTYRPAGPNGNILLSFELPSGVGIYGGFAGDETALEQRNWVANPTILSGDLNGDDVPTSFSNMSDNSQHVLHTSAVGLITVIDGVTISGGNAGSNGRGGGISLEPGVTSPTIANCTIEHNRSGGWGAGLYAISTSAVVSACVFRNNRTDTDGGGANFGTGSATITNCLFEGNRAGWGGGMVLAGPHFVANCRIVNNMGDARGAAFMIVNWNPVIRNCVVTGNNGFRGACAYVFYNNGLRPNPTFLQCLIASNTSTGPATFECISADITLTNCTIAMNTAGAGSAAISLYSDSFGVSHGTVQNCVVWGNTPAQIAAPSPNTAVVSYSDVQGGFAGQGNFLADPLFANVLAGDFSLGATSGCIDAGSNSRVPAGVLLDGSGLPRFRDDPGMPNVGTSGGAGGSAIVDVGAFEFQGTTCYANCDTSTIPPVLNVLDFACYLNRFAAGDSYTNCDGSTTPPVLNVLDFGCFLNRFAAGCN